MTENSQEILDAEASSYQRGMDEGYRRGLIRALHAVLEAKPFLILPERQGEDMRGEIYDAIRKLYEEVKI